MTSTSGNNINIGNRTEIGNKIADRGGIDHDRVGNRDLYNRPENRARKADPAVANQQIQRARPSADRANNVFADRHGNVARANGNSWESHRNGSWQSSRDNAATREARPNNTRPSTGISSPSTRQSLNYGDLNRSNHARQMGSRRETSHHNFSRSRPTPHRGGGRRR